MNFTEDNIEQFIIDNKNKFSKCDPSAYHENNFIQKLSFKFTIFKNIIPYLFRVILIWCVITIFSIWIWNDAIRKDRHEITLKHKIENIINIIKK